MISLEPTWVREKMAQFMREDVPNGDITTLATVAPHIHSIAEIQAGDNLVFAGSQVIPYCFPNTCQIELKVVDGQLVQAGTVLGLISGPAQDILSHERVMLNLVQRLCAIATKTRQYTQHPMPDGFQILDTRKTTPGLRHFEKYAVAVGGGWNHRMDLSTAILIKDNHLKAAGSVYKAVNRMKEAYPHLPIELEVDTLEQLQEGLTAGVKRFLLDNMSPERVKQAVSIVRNDPDGHSIFLEASGGINELNLDHYVWTGINAVSIGALTTQVQNVDIRLEFQ